MPLVAVTSIPAEVTLPLRLPPRPAEVMAPSGPTMPRRPASENALFGRTVTDTGLVILAQPRGNVPASAVPVYMPVIGPDATGATGAGVMSAIGAIGGGGGLLAQPTAVPAISATVKSLIRMTKFS